MEDCLAARKHRRWGRLQWVFAVAVLFSFAINIFAVQSFLRQRNVTRLSSSVIHTIGPPSTHAAKTSRRSQLPEIKFPEIATAPSRPPSFGSRENGENVNSKTSTPNAWLASLSSNASSLRLRALELLGRGEINNAPESNIRPPLIKDGRCVGDEVDPFGANHPDCGVLRNEFGLTCTVSGDPPMENITDPYEKGYIRVPGLTDPSIVAAAIYDEFRMINDLLPPRFPLAAVKGFIDNPHEHGVNGHLPTAPITIDVVYTYVDGNEESFLNDLRYFKMHQVASAAQEPEQRNSVKISTGIVGALSTFWESILRVMPKISQTMISDGAMRPNLFHRQLIERELNAIGGSLAEISASPISDNQTILAALRADAGGDDNRFRDYGELRHSLRGIHRHILLPMKRRVKMFTKSADDLNHHGIKFSEQFGKIYIIVSNVSQRPNWISEQDPTIVWIEHRSLFPNASRSLPNFNSRAIESVIHRIPGLSRHYLYLNNDFIISRPVSFFDFFRPLVVGKEIRFVPAILVGHANKYVCKGRERYKDMCFPTGGTWAAEAFINNQWLLKNVFKRDHLPFKLGFVHTPQMMDRLHVVRMYTEPTLRQEVCATRGSRKRNAGNLLYGYPYIHYSLWLHYDRNIDSAYSAILASPSAKEAATTPQSLETSGSQRTLWAYLRQALNSSNPSQYDGSSSTSPVKDLWEGMASAAMAGKEGAEVQLPTDELLMLDPNGTVTLKEFSSASPELTTVARSRHTFGSTDHWLFDVVTSFADPVWDQETSIRYYFAMVRSKRAATRHLQDLLPRFGKVLSVALNDDLPAVRDVPHPYFNISQLLVNELCTTMTEKRFTAAIKAGRYELEETSRRYLPVSVNPLAAMPPFNNKKASDKGLAAAVDFDFSAVQAPGHLRNESNTQAFVGRMYEAITGMCKVGTAKLAQYKAQQSVGDKPIDNETLLAKPSDPNSHIYGSAPLVEGFALASVGSPDSEFARAMPPWEM